MLKPQTDKFLVGAVSGSMLYLTSLMPPTFGALLGVDLSRPELEPEVSPSIAASCLTLCLAASARKQLQPVVHSLR